MKNIFVFMLLGFVLIAGCSRTGTNSKQENAIATENVAANDVSKQSFITVTNNDGKQIVRILFNGNDVEIEYSGNKFVGALKGDKRKYTDKSGTMVAEFKFSEPTKLKLRTPEGQLLWKIKIDTDKIKVSNNEENLNPYQIKMGYPDKVKVLDASEQELGDARFDAVSGKMEITGSEGVMFVKSDKLSAAYGVLLMSSIPDRDKYIILAELLAKNL